jgi:hypothetical protein
VPELRLHKRLLVNMQKASRVEPDRKRELRAIHQDDFELALGSQFEGEWRCSVCGETRDEIPAAFVKQSAGLDPICIRCLVTSKA